MAFDFVKPGGIMPEEIKGKIEESEQEEDQELEETEEILDADLVEQEETEALKLEIEELSQKSAEYLDGWQRERAEFANYKRRMDREREMLKFNITGNVIRSYLEILDDLDLALKNKPTEGEGATWAEGIELIYRKFITVLEAEGVETMQVEGQLFDPNLHEAISQEPNEDFESGEIIAVVRNGYSIGERVLRPASVRVAQ
jgi:molecular chaperone GrpE